MSSIPRRGIATINNYFQAYSGKRQKDSSAFAGNVKSGSLFAKTELAQVVRELASDLLNGNETILNISIRLEVELGAESQEWPKIKDDTQDAVHEARVLGTKSSALLADTILLLEQSLARPDDADIVFEIKASTEVLQKSYSDAGAVENELSEVLKSIQTFRDHWPEGSSEYNAGVQPMINDAEEIISRLTRLAPPLNAKMANLIENSSFPGSMEVLMRLLPQDAAMRARELFEGKSNVNIETNVEVGDGSGPPHDASNSSTLKCLLGVGHFVSKDLSHFTDVLASDQKDQWSPQEQRVLLAIYSVLKETLDTLVKYLEEGKIEQEDATASAKTFTAKSISFIRVLSLLTPSRLAGRQGSRRE